ncbi:MAG: VOC family protein [Sulfitobacter sp.]
MFDVPQEQSGGVNATGYGDTRPWFWLYEENATSGTMQIALQAKNRAEVGAFHAEALQAGGTDNGPPGLRPHYHSDYYAAFVLDPDGHNIEVVCHAPQ